ncbi:Uncharacterised protein [Shigella sonnei]|nr:Uncharacterised protein [Shigella sonnei]
MKGVDHVLHQAALGSVKYKVLLMLHQAQLMEIIPHYQK